HILPVHDALPICLANPDAASEAEIVVLTVPFESQAATIESVREHCRGKLFVDATVPLMPPKVGTVQLPEEGCAAVRAQKLLGDEVTVVSAFQNVAAAKLQSDEELDCDVLVAGDKAAARDVVISLVEAAGLREIGRASCRERVEGRADGAW